MARRTLSSIFRSMFGSVSSRKTKVAKSANLLLEQMEDRTTPATVTFAGNTLSIAYGPGDAAAFTTTAANNVNIQFSGNLINGGTAGSGLTFVFGAGGKISGLLTKATATTQINVTGDSGVGDQITFGGAGYDGLAAGISVDSNVDLVDINGAVKALSLTVAGASNLGANITTLGLQTYSGTSALTSSVGLDSGGGSIQFGSSLNGNNFNLAIAAGTGAGTTTFIGPVSNLGTGTGAALSVASTGLVRFQNTLTGNSGLTGGATSNFHFDENVTLGNGDTATNLAGNIQLDGLAYLGFDGITMNAVTVSSSAVSLNSNGSSVQLGTVTGAQNLVLSPGIAAGTTTVTGLVSNLGSGIGAALTVSSGVTGLVQFLGKVNANSGVVTSFGSSVQFDDDVTLGNGDTSSSFVGSLQLDGLVFSAFDGISANSVILSTGAVTVQATAGTIMIGTIDGAQTLNLDGGPTNNILVTSVVGSKTAPAGLTITDSFSTYFFDDVNVNGGIQLNNTATSIGFGADITANSINAAANPFSVGMTGSNINIAGSSVFNNPRTVVIGNAPTDTFLFAGGLDVVSISLPFATQIAGSISSNGSLIHLDNVLLTSDTLIDTTNGGAAPAGAPLSITSGINFAGYVLTTKTGAANSTTLTGPLTITSGELITESGDLDLGTAIAGAAITVTGNTLIQAKSGKLTVGALSTIAAGTNNLTLQSDNIFINSVPGSITSSADVSLAPLTINRDIYMGAAAASLLPGVKVSQSMINAINAGRLVIGQTGGSGLVTVGTTSVANPLAIIVNGGGGKVSVTGTLTSTVASPSVYPAVFIDGSGSTTVLGANILTAGVPVVINDAVQVNAALVVIDTSFGVPAGANVDITGGSAGIFATSGSTNDLTILAGTTGVVTLGALLGFGTGGTGSLVDDLNVTAASIVLPTTDTINNNMNLTAPAISVGGNLTAGSALGLTGAVTLTGISTFSGDGITVNGAIDADGNNLVLDGKSGAVLSGAINVTGTVTNGAALSVQDSTGATFSGAVTAQNLNINANNTGTVAFNNNLDLAGGISAGAGGYALSLLGSTVFVGGPVSFLNLGNLTLGDNDLDSITVTSGMTRFSPTLLQGVQSFGGTVILNQASATNAGGNLTLGVNSLDLGFTPGGLSFGALSILASGAVVATAGTVLSGTLTINAGTISQSGGIWSPTGAAILTASGNITLNAANSFPTTLSFSGANVSINNIAPSTLTGANTATGTLSLTTTSPIGINQLPGSTVNVSGGATLTAPGAPIILNQPGNFLTGPVGFNGSNVVLVGTGPMALAASLATGTLNVTAGGAITDTGAILVALSGTFAAGPTNDITLDNANNFGSVGITNGNNVIINNTGILGLDASAISGALNVTANGSITDNGGVVVAGSAKFTVGASNNITLDDVANNFLSVEIVSGNNVVLNDINALALDTSAISGALAVSTNGAITDIGVLTVTGASNFSAGAGNNITLDNANNFSSAGIGSGNNVIINDINLLALDASTITGTLDVTTNGPITDNGALIVAGAASFFAGSANDITLDNLNDFLSVGIGSGLNVILNDINAIGLNASPISGTLAVTANGPITDNGALIVAGAASFAAGAANNITLDNANNFLSAGIVSGLNVVLNDIDALLLDASTISGALGVTANGAITDNGVLLVAGAATFNAGATYDITLDNANNFVGSVGFTARDVRLTDTNALILGPGTASGILDVTSVGITQSAALSIAGISTLTSPGGNITLADPTNVFTGQVAFSGSNVQLSDASPLILSASAATGTLDLIGKGITQTGALTVTGNTTLTATGQDIDLDLANSFGGKLGFNGANVSLNDITATALTAGNATGTFDLVSGGSVTQFAGKLTIGGAASVTASGNITLDAVANALAGGLTIQGANVTIANSIDLALGGKATGNLVANASGDITDQAVLSVAGTALLGTTGASNGINLDQLSALGLITANTADGDATIINTSAISFAGIVSGIYSLTALAGGISDGGAADSSGGFILAAPGSSFLVQALTGPGGLTFNGAGTLNVSGINTFTGATLINSGVLILTGSLGSSDVTMAGGTLRGEGDMASLTATGGTVRPGQSPGIFNSAGPATMGVGSAFVVEIDGKLAGTGYSQVVASDVVLGSTLGLAATVAYTPMIGDRFTIVDNTGLNPVTGIFAGYPEGSFVPLGSQLYAITYKGGADANDVVLIAVSTIPTPTGPVITAPFSLAAGYTAVNIGNGTIDLISPAKSVRAIQPFPGYLGDLAVNAMDRNGDGKADSLLVAVASAGAVPHVMVIDAATGRSALSFYAFATGFLGGLSISSGLANIGGVNKSVITVGAGAGAQPSVSVFNSVTGQFIKQFYAFAEEYTGGVNVAMSVPDSMGHSIVVVGAKTVDHIVTFDLNHTDIPESSFFAFGGGVAGVNISVADIDFGGLNEIVAGVGPGGEPRVSIFRSTGALMDSFLAYAPGFLGGVNVGISDANADGQYEILTGSAAGTPGTLAGFAYPALNVVDAAFLTDYDTWLSPASNLTL